MNPSGSGSSSTYFAFKARPNGKSADTAFKYDQSLLSRVPNVSSANWSSRDNNTLLSTISSLETDVIDWQIVSSLLRERVKFYATPMECLMQYRNVLDPSINRSAWTREEVDKLLELVSYYNEHEWCTIAEELGTNRTPMQCLQYYQRNHNQRLIRSNNVWTEEEERQLKQSIEVHGNSDWSNVANDLPGRTPKQCFNRYRRSSHCQGNVISGHWLEEEEKLLYFACISMNAPTSDSCKRSHEELNLLLQDNIISNGSIINSGSKRGKKRTLVLAKDDDSVDEETAVVETIPGYGSVEAENVGSRFKGWTAVAQLIPGKNDVQCREKWNNNLDPTLYTGKYSKEEDVLLLKLVDKLGEGHWTLISSYMVGRSDSSVRSRHAVLTADESVGKAGKGKKTKTKYQR